MKRNILSNISFNFLIKVITYLFSFLTVLYVARVLQPAAYGRISFSSSYAGYFVMLARLGMPIYAMRACAEHRDDRRELGRIFNELWSINVLLSIISGVIFLISVALVPKLGDNREFLLVFGCSIVFQMLGCEWLFRGLEQFRFLAVSSFICKLVSFICILIFVRSPEHVLLYAIFSVMTGYGSQVVCFIMLRRHVDVSFRIHINTKHFRPLFVFFLMSCAVYIYSSLDLTMLGFMRSDYETGIYNLAAKGRSVLTMTGGLVWGAVLPAATGLWKDGNRKKFEALASRAIVAVCGIQLLATVFCMIFAKELILLAGGEAYLGAVPAFRILVLSLVPVGASNILGGQVLIPAGKEKRLLGAEVAGAVFNFIANLILIPYLSIVGAAITTTVSEIIVVIICLYYVKKDLGMDFCVGLLKRGVRRGRKEWELFRIRALDRLMRERLPMYCPCCDTYLKRFVNGGYDRRPDIYDPGRYAGMDQEVICPVCRSLPRHRILAVWMGEHIEDVGSERVLRFREDAVMLKDEGALRLREDAVPLRDMRVLHFAQEKSLRMWMDRNGVGYATADLNKPADLKIDIEDTGLEDGAYDLIICNHVLEHVSDYGKALKELKRIVSPQGLIIISFPVDSSYATVYEDATVVSREERIRCFGQYDHLRVFGRDSVSMLRSFGFTVDEIRGSDCDVRIKPVVGPGDYDLDILYVLRDGGSL